MRLTGFAESVGAGAPIPGEVEEKGILSSLIPAGWWPYLLVVVVLAVVVLWWRRK